MLNNFIADEEATWSDRNILLEGDTENTIDVVCKQLGSFQENGNKKYSYT